MLNRLNCQLIMARVIIDRDSTQQLTADKNLCEVGAELITLEECRKIIGNVNISDNELELIRNNLIGIVDSMISSYLDKF